MVTLPFAIGESKMEVILLCWSALDVFASDLQLKTFSMILDIWHSTIEKLNFDLFLLEFQWTG